MWQKAKVKNLNLSAEGIFERFFSFVVKYFISLLPQANTFLIFFLIFFYHIFASLTQKLINVEVLNLNQVKYSW